MHRSKQITANGNFLRSSRAIRRFDLRKSMETIKVPTGEHQLMHKPYAKLPPCGICQENRAKAPDKMLPRFA